MNRISKVDSDILDEDIQYHLPRSSEDIEGGLGGGGGSGPDSHSPSPASLTYTLGDEDFYDAQEGSPKPGGAGGPGGNFPTRKRPAGGRKSGTSSGRSSIEDPNTLNRGGIAAAGGGGDGRGSLGGEDGGLVIGKGEDGKPYVNLKAFAGLTSPPIKPDNSNREDDVSSLSSLSYQQERENSNSKEDSLTTNPAGLLGLKPETELTPPPPLPPSSGPSSSHHHIPLNSLSSHTATSEIDNANNNNANNDNNKRFMRPSSSSAMKLFKNVDYSVNDSHPGGGGGGGEDMEDDEDNTHTPPPSSVLPGKYDFNYSSLKQISSPIPDSHSPKMSSLLESPNPNMTAPALSGKDPTNSDLQHHRDSREKREAKRNSLQRRSLKINEEVLLASALFGLNEFYSQMQPNNNNNASTASNSTAVPAGTNPQAASSSSSSSSSGHTTDIFKDKLRLAQNIQAHEGPIWAMKFSPTGQYLATGGQDGKVFIWCVVQHPKSTKQFSSDSTESPQQSGPNSIDEYEDSPVGDNNGGNERFSGSGSSRRRSSTRHTGDYTSLIHSFIDPQPYRIYEGHTHDITDLSWSKSNFLLSSSMDKTVRLWHASRNECLQYFRHPDIVTCVEFHPLHDRFFVSGCFDRRLRVWDIIPTGNVREWVSANDTITAVAFSPDGQTVAGGLIQGQIFFYEYDGMKYKTQMDCKNRNGKYKKGCKVSGISYYQRKDVTSDGTSITSNNTSTPGIAMNQSNPPPINNSQPHSSFFKKKSHNFSPNQLLVTTNDNRIRLCSLEDYSTFCKYKGLKNRSMQIKASFSDDCEFVICGSEYGQVFIWKTFDEHLHSSIFTMFKKDVLRNKLYENFDANEDGSAVIAAVFAPIESVRRYVKAHKDLLLELLQNQSIAQNWVPELAINNSDSTTTTPQRNSGSQRDITSIHLATRIICTADLSGQIRVFFRIN